MRRADLWEAGADERERLANEREGLANEREALADERERLADRHDQGLDRRETDGMEAAALTGEVDESAEVALAQAAMRRAEAAMRRAEVQLLRARQGSARAGAGLTRRQAGSQRAGAARMQETSDGDERAWLADRRDFVAAERENLAGLRDDVADERDEAAGRRERAADERERESLDWERALDRRTAAQRGGGPRRRPVDHDDAPHTEHRASSERQRENAALRRRAAAQERARAAESWGPQPYGPMLLANFAELARQLVGPDELADALPRVLKFTVGVVAGCDSASVTLWRHSRVVDTIASDATAAELDDLQFGTGLGPGPEALHSEHPIYAPQLTDSTRWPVLAATAAQLAVASALCHGLFVHQPAQWSPLGAFSLYSATSDAFSGEDQEFVALLAAYLAVAVAMAHRRDEVDRREAALHRGLSTRDLIGQAKGILMERQRLSAGDAFDLLRRASQRLNRKLTDVAQQLTETGELPTKS